MNILTSVILVSFKSNKIIENAIKAIGEENLIFICYRQCISTIYIISPCYLTNLN